MTSDIPPTAAATSPEPQSDPNQAPRFNTTWPQTSHKRERRRIALGVFFLVFGSFALALAGYHYLRQSQLESYAIKGAATITDRYIGSNNAPTLLISVTSDHGITATNHVHVDPAFWHDLAVGDSIAVRYVPSDPGNSCPLYPGSTQSTGPHPRKLLMMGIVSITMGILLLFQGIKALRTPAPAPQDFPAQLPPN